MGHPCVRPHPLAESATAALATCWMQYVASGAVLGSLHSMATTTVGFAVADEDKALLDRLVARFGNGNRSAYLRETLRVMESLAIAEELQELQERNAGKLAARGITTYEEAVRYFEQK